LSFNPPCGGENDRLVSESFGDNRTEAQRDRDRVLYSGEFARLAEITQVVSPTLGYAFHNRMTHSLKVGQVARRLTEYLLRDNPSLPDGLLDPDRSEAVGLAHDLGHPPFGHVAEHELNDLTQEAKLLDGFEGNAQSFRIVARLAASDAPGDDPNADGPGLNWTRGTLCGIIKYPWGKTSAPPGKERKWGHYDSEASVFEWARVGQVSQAKSLTADLMDWADDITYAIHDLIDFFRAGRIPLDRLDSKGASAEWQRLFEFSLNAGPWKGRKPADFRSALDPLFEYLQFNSEYRYLDSGEHRRALYTLTSYLITHAVSGTKLTCADGTWRLVVDAKVRELMDAMKQFIWFYVILSPDLAIQQAGQRVAIQNVFRSALKFANEKKEYSLFGMTIEGRLKRTNDDLGRTRIVTDFVAGLTEAEVMRLHRLLSGAA
jgi:dGTPase